MNLLRRPEVCVLIAIVVAGLVWVAMSQRTRGPQTGSQVRDDAMPGLRDFRITRAEMVADGAHRRLRIDFTARHGASPPLEVRPPTVRLLDAAGEDVPVFFVPGAFPPALPAGPVAASWIEFWLTNVQASGPLTFELAGHQVRLPKEVRVATGG